ncbi:MAG: hypothetical protein MK180_03280 [Rhodobacteraceae bacterium]|nr:hypothetical protein [Paracoccaceae bacterium]
MNVPLRKPEKVLSLGHMGVMQPSRLSFLRQLMRDLARFEASITRPVWDVNEQGHGHAVYTVTLGGYAYSLIAFSQHLADEDRSDRVIATAWDAAFVLFDGVPDDADITRLKENVPHQEAGRLTAQELVLSRANKSVRLFTHVVEALRNGRQPERDQIADCGYLMRTTAVYGNGKFGLADRTAYDQRPGLSGPFAAEMLTVWLIRGFTHDLAEHLGGAEIDRNIKRFLGVGNATGLGMAPFLVSHPQLLHAWFHARETAISAVLSKPTVTAGEADTLLARGAEAAAYLASWEVADEDAMDEIRDLRREWDDFFTPLTRDGLCADGGLKRAFARAQQGSPALEELAAAWILEPFDHSVELSTEGMATQLDLALDGAMTCAELRALIEEKCAWALEPDFDCKSTTAQFWYVSEEKLEPRLGARHEEPGADRESPLDTARAMQSLHAALPDDAEPCFTFLARAPEHRAIARRIQHLARHDYGEIRANLIGEEAAPIHLLRAKLSFFGATRFDPKSKLWTRVTLAQGLPLRDEIGHDVPWLPSL